MSSSALRPRRYDLIVFDWDGTLFDSTALIVRAIQAACRDLDAPVPSDEAAAHVIGLGLQDALQRAVPDLPIDLYPELGRRYRQHYFASHDQVTLFAGVPELLAGLRERNHWLAVATGKSRHGLDEALRISALGGLFDATRTADETRSKPHPQMLQELMREFGVDPERTLMIGDTTHDLQLAANAGTDAVAVAYGAHPPEQLGDLRPLTIAHSVRELHDWLASHG
ncbi:HAD family hydrolase [Sphaerotilus natans subsp. natans DSM 6575]|uniref:HAD family hydrolase n=1 Tax=Sphaerotilus natans subsp. natans DSM 6575 TaxID=1286631 RepID=A0A059KN37_9BURK|nr:HAD-IIIA family hydrolase [Sphaerotilus natans]KDB52790.1 HAD family hydrolase [Sphaerotilus natans subsp. natans DSM 6575]SIR62904.1 phosphoglycolate phosphatase [Sphaerotilus natans]